ncbi:uncharacterized protein LOC119682058 [Teleopsis dalmanni]|uniref:uncharacterized protein LOC119682058 n=1 Tax=Teleopsis dalmanni TaxID=139649 RepID=UPI0018CD89D9|nr:uncharacterized protein LOC119682058 [Teleopsis dalmanni]
MGNFFSQIVSFFTGKPKDNNLTNTTYIYAASSDLIITDEGSDSLSDITESSSGSLNVNLSETRLAVRESLSTDMAMEAPSIQNRLAIDLFRHEDYQHNRIQDPDSNPVDRKAGGDAVVPLEVMNSEMPQTQPNPFDNSYEQTISELEDIYSHLSNIEAVMNNFQNLVDTFQEWGRNG